MYPPRNPQRPRFGGPSGPLGPASRYPDNNNPEQFPWIGPPLPPRNWFGPPSQNPGPPMPPVGDKPPPLYQPPGGMPGPVIDGELQPLWMTSMSPNPQGWNPRWLDPMLGPGKPINMTQEQWLAWLQKRGIDPGRWI